MDERALRNQARNLIPVMAIGKNGITQGSVQQLEKELDVRGLVKVRLLKGYLEGHTIERKEGAAELAKLARATLVQIVGNIAVLYRRPHAPERATQQKNQRFSSSSNPRARFK